MKRALEPSADGEAGAAKGARLEDPAPSAEELKRQQRADKLRAWQAAQKSKQLAAATGDDGGGGGGGGAHPFDTKPAGAEGVRLGGAIRLSGARGLAARRGAGAALSASGALFGGGAAADGGGADGSSRPGLRLHALDDDDDDAAAAAPSRSAKRRARGTAPGGDDGDDEDDGADDAAAAAELDPLDRFMSAIQTEGAPVRTAADARREEAGDVSGQTISLAEIFDGVAGYGSFFGGARAPGGTTGGGAAVGRGLGGFDDVMTDSAPTDADASADEGGEGAGGRAPVRKRTQAALARAALNAANAAASAEAAAPPLDDDNFHAAFLKAIRAGGAATAGGSGNGGDAGASGAEPGSGGGGAVGAGSAGADGNASMTDARAPGPQRFFDDDDGDGGGDGGGGGSGNAARRAGSDDEGGGDNGGGDSGGSSDDAREAATAYGAKRRKELPAVDHAAASYAPFRKAFFAESARMRAESEAEVAATRAALELRVHGKKCPRPLARWTESGLPDAILRQLERLGCAAPFPIQRQALPALMAGRDVIGIAKTGSGKTLAYALPMLRHVLDQPPVAHGEGPIALVMVPTRELAAQVFREASRVAKPTAVRVACIYGGTSVKAQIDALKRGAEAVVCTPGRMIDMLTANGGRVTNLARVTYVVLDEADRMFDLGFEPQITRVLANVRPDRQLALFSATFPRAVDALARALLVKPLQLIVGGVSVVSSCIEQHVEVLAAEGKYRRLRELLDEFTPRGQALVFVERAEVADALFAQLVADRNVALCIHGRMDQADRDSAIADFKAAAAPVLVATSLAARGLDVRQLVLVCNYDVPTHYEDYVHRVGRVGRAERKGWAYTLLTPEQEKHAPDLVRALELANHDVPDDLAVLANTFADKKRAGLTGQGGKLGGFRKSGGKGLALDQASMDRQADKDRKARRVKLRAEGVEVSASDSDDDDDDAAAAAARGRGATAAQRAGVNLPLAPPPPGSAAAFGRAAPSAAAAAPALSAAEAVAAAASHAAHVVGARLGIDPAVTARQAAERAAAALAAQALAAQQPPPADRPLSAAEALAAAQQRAHAAAQAVANQIGLSFGLGGGQGAASGLGGNGGGAGGLSLPLPPPPPPGLAGAAALGGAAGAAGARGGAGGAGAAGAAAGGGGGGGSKKWLSAEIEINDYPKTARWKVTHRDALVAITEWTRAAITTKGVYTPPGAKPPAGERKLYLLIEAEDTAQLKEAKQEIKRILEETSAYAAPDEKVGGRYVV